MSYTGTLTGAFANAADGALVVVGANRYFLAYHDGNAVTLTVPATGTGDAYAAWATASGLTGSTSSTSADPDGDGIPNLNEFATSGDPLSASPNPKIVSRMLDLGGARKELTLTLPVRTGAIFSGTKNLVSAPVDGVVYTIQGSLDLVDFTTLEISEAATATVNELPVPPAGWEYRSFKAAAGFAGDHLFLRTDISPAPAAP